MKDLTNKEFKFVCERDISVSALEGIEWCIDQFLIDEELSLNDTYANGRGIEELLSTLWMARLEIKKYKKKYESHEQYDHEYEKESSQEFDNIFNGLNEGMMDLNNTKDITKKSVSNALLELNKKYPEMGSNGLTEYLGGKDYMNLPNEERFILEVKTAIAYIKEVIKLAGIRKKPSSDQTSYGFKHDAERWGGKNGMEGYICNMAGIVAMWIHPLVKIKVIDKNPNPISNLPTYFQKRNFSR